jgi:hypothetical protein
MDFEACCRIRLWRNDGARSGHPETDEAFIKPASLGMSIEESKQIASNIQACMVSDQVDRHNRALTGCRFCGQRVRTKGY